MFEIENNPDIRTAEQLMELEAEINPAAGISDMDAPVGDASAEAGVAPTHEDDIVEPASGADGSTNDLIVDEGKGVSSTSSATKSAPVSDRKRPKVQKRKAEAMLSPNASASTHASKIRRASGTPANSTSATSTPTSNAEPERTSRSGRVIKPKKFGDETSDSHAKSGQVNHP